MKQDWTHLLFLHWEFSPELVQATLPPGLRVDTFGDKAFIGVVPFFMERIRPVLCPAVPGISWFQELNLRTYVYDEQGRPGIWFYTLDCNQWLAVKLARWLFHLPYRHARMRSENESGTLDYQSTRKQDSHVQEFRYPADLRFSQEATPGSLGFFLIERYRLFSTDRRGDLYSGIVHHRPYRFQEVQITDYSTRLFSLCGFEEPITPPVSSLIAEPVSVNIHPLVKSVLVRA